MWLIKHGIGVHLSGIRHPQTQGKVERFHRSLDQLLYRRGWPAEPGLWQDWLDAFRHEDNQVRPHAALGLATPATRWQPSSRRYQSQPPDWQYEPGAELRRLSGCGQLSLAGGRWEISRALAREWVQLHRLPGRLLIAYRNTCLREIDLVSGRTTTPTFTPHSLNQMCQGCPDSGASGMS